MKSVLDSLSAAFEAAPSMQKASLPDLLIKLLFAAVLGLSLSLLYKRIGGSKTRRGFLHALVLLPLVASSVTLIIGNNIVRAFGLIGAVSIIRFRTVIKNPRDMAFVFMAITLGMASGSALPIIGLFSLGLFAAIAWVMEAGGYGRRFEAIQTAEKKANKNKAPSHKQQPGQGGAAPNDTAGPENDAAPIVFDQTGDSSSRGHNGYHSVRQPKLAIPSSLRDVIAASERHRKAQ